MNKRNKFKIVTGLASTLLISSAILSQVTQTKAETTQNPLYQVTAATPELAAYPDHIINGSFEDPIVKTDGGYMINANDMPGWNTTASDQMIEIIRGDGGVNHHFKPSHGNQWAEINANEVGELYQIVSTTPGTILKWQVDHAGRDQTDTMEIFIGDLSNNAHPVEIIEANSPDREWKHYEGLYEVGTDQTLTYFGFKSIKSALPSYGNYLDNVSFEVYSKNPMRPTEHVVGGPEIEPENNWDHKFPPVIGKPGEKQIIDPTDLPEIPGWIKPSKPFEITVPDKPGVPIDVPYTKEGETPSKPVDPNGKEIPHPGIEFPKFPGKPGEKLTIDPKEVPEIPGYEKPKKPFEVTIPDPGKEIEIPYIPKEESKTPSKPVDPDGKEIPHPGIEFPKFPGKPGEKLTIDPKEVPEIPGYEKPKKPFEVTIPDPGKEIEIPYIPKEERKTPSKPVDPNGKEIPHPGIEFPKFPGKPGEKLTIDPKEVPEIPGYEKPKKPFEIIVPKEGKEIEIPYIPKEESKTPSKPVDPNGKEIPHPGIEFPKFPGKPGKEIEIDPTDLPEIPNYNRPKDKFKVTIPEDGKTIEIIYTPKEGASPSNGKILPNTGEQATIWASVFGVIMLALAGLGLAKKQKNNKNN